MELLKYAQNVVAEAAAVISFRSRANGNVGAVGPPESIARTELIIENSVKEEYKRQRSLKPPVLHQLQSMDYDADHSVSRLCHDSSTGSKRINIQPLPSLLGTDVHLTRVYFPSRRVPNCSLRHTNGRGLEPATLVLSGGGMKAFYMLGALSRLDEDYMLYRIRRFAGTSVGALISLLLCLDYSPLEIMTQALWIPSLNKYKPKTVKELVSVIFYSARDCFADIMEVAGQLIEKRGLQRNVTFAELRAATDGRELLVVVARLNQYSISTRIFSSATTPQDSVLLAVKTSCSVPLITDPVWIDGEPHVDGCLVNNFPVDLALTEWNDNLPVLAVGMDKGRRLLIANSVRYLMIPKCAKIGEGIMSSSVERVEMYMHGRAFAAGAAAKPTRRYSV